MDQCRFMIVGLILLIGAILVVNPDGFARTGKGLGDGIRNFRNMQSGDPWKQPWEIESGLTPAKRMWLRIAGIAFIAAAIAVIAVS